MAIENYQIRKAYPGSHSDKYGELEIVSENLVYTELQNTHSGLQCNNMNNEKLIHDKCRQVSKLIKEIDQLNK